MIDYWRVVCNTTERLIRPKPLHLHAEGWFYHYPSSQCCREIPLAVCLVLDSEAPWCSLWLFFWLPWKPRNGLKNRGNGDLGVNFVKLAAFQRTSMLCKCITAHNDIMYHCSISFKRVCKCLTVSSATSGNCCGGGEPTCWVIHDSDLPHLQNDSPLQEDEVQDERSVHYTYVSLQKADLHLQREICRRR